MERVAIVGVGLIGASFALALRKAGYSGEIVGVSSARSIEAGIQAGAITRGVSLEEAAHSSDLIYLAQPIDQILLTLRHLGPVAPANCLITDAGSTKGSIVAAAAEHLRQAGFIGGHPMAGKESRGAESADADLFRDRPYVLATDLVPKHQTLQASLMALHRWLNRIGAVVYEMSAAEHDRTVALTSHLPQLLSTALAASLAKQQSAATSQIFGPGLLDMTRLAMSAPEVWKSVLETNRDFVLDALATYEGMLSEVRGRLERGNIEDVFDVASEFAHKIRGSPFVESPVTKVQR